MNMLNIWGKNRQNVSIFLLFLIAIMLIHLSACSNLSEVRIDGIDNFRPEDSSTSLTSFLLPDSNFLATYEYEYADYHYYEKWPLSKENKEIVIMELRYSPDNYGLAKEHCLQYMNLSQNNIYYFNDYIFVENYALPEHYSNLVNEDNAEFPYHFNMFVYNDTKCTLLFLGFYCGEAMKQEVNEAIKNWEQFLHAYYSDFYNFYE